MDGVGSVQGLLFGVLLLHDFGLPAVSAGAVCALRCDARA